MAGNQKFSTQADFGLRRQHRLCGVYFANKYPTAQIYSVEPEHYNFKLLMFNTAFYDHIHPLKSALWDKETFIRINEQKEFNPLGFMTFETTADDPDAFKTTTVGKLLSDSGFDERLHETRLLT